LTHDDQAASRSVLAFGPFRCPEQIGAAEAVLQQSLSVARRQGALSWELRAATSLSRSWKNQGRTEEARDLLQPVYTRFTEGFETTDLIKAQNLLDELTRLSAP
jgi:predicted ATPase